MNTPAPTPAAGSPKVVSIDRGAGWIFEGFAYFMKAPLPWMGVMVLFFIISLALAFVPIIGGLALNILMPVFMAGLMLGCRAQAHGQPFVVNYLFEGFSNNLTQLIVVGLLYFIGFILITILMVIIIVVFMGMSVGLSGLENLQSGDAEFIQQNFIWLLLAVLVGAALYVPLLMSYWFAPCLVVLGNITPVDAMKMSFMACLLNILPFLVYGLVALILCIIAAIPFALGFLILGPMLTVSVYIAYREIFSAE